MMQLLMAAALFLLAVARVPALRRNGRDTVFLAALFAGASSILLNPAVYVFVDRLAGGVNLAKLALNTFMIIGLWYLRNAVLHAVSPEAGTGARWVRMLPLIVTLVLQARFFALSGPTTTTVTWGWDYRHLPTAGLFAIMMTLFIAWSCAEIAYSCFKYVPRMRPAFKVGFIMVGVGCCVSVAAMVQMSILILADTFKDLGWMKGAGAVPFSVIEMIAVVLVGVGLTIPAIAGRATRRREQRDQQLTIARVTPIRERVLQSSNLERMLEADEAADPGEHLHRMMVEIWDAELAAGPGESVLTAEEREYLLSVEPSKESSGRR
jgi:hypothetical protein